MLNKEMYAIKLSTNENVPVNSLAEVQSILSLRDKYIKEKNLKTISLVTNDGTAVAHIYPEYIVGWIEIKGHTLDSIVAEVSEQEEIKLITNPIVDAIGEII